MSKGLKTISLVVFWGVTLLTILVIYSQNQLPHSSEIHCQHFKTQREAQERFNSNKTAYSHLDRDNDDLACEGLK